MLISHKYKNDNFILQSQQTNLCGQFVYNLFFYFLLLILQIPEPLVPSATKISRRRRLHRLQSMHTCPLSRRNTAGRIIMYSISLRGSPLVPFPFESSLFLSCCSRSLTWRKKSREKRNTENCRDEGSPRRFPRRKTTERETKGRRGPRLPLSNAIPGYTHCWTLHHPHFLVRESYELRDEGRRKGKERLHAVSSTRRSPASELCGGVRERKGAAQGEAERYSKGEGGGGQGTW